MKNKTEHQEQREKYKMEICTYLFNFPNEQSKQRKAAASACDQKKLQLSGIECISIGKQFL